MDAQKQREYAAPAVVYEAVLVAHAVTTPTTTGISCQCMSPAGDLLDSIK